MKDGIFTPKDKKISLIILICGAVLFLVMVIIAIFDFPMMLRPKPQKGIRVGYISDLQKRASAVGLETFRAIMLGVKDYNADYIRLEAAHAANVAEFREAYFNLRDEGVKIFIIGGNSTILMDIKEFVEEDKVFVFNIFANADELLSEDGYFIRNISDAKSEAKAIAGYVNKKFPQKKLLIMQDSNNYIYTKSFADTFTNEVKLDYSVIKTDFIKNNVGDLEKKIKSKAFDVVYINAGGTLESGDIVRLIHIINPDAKIIISPWLNNHAFFKIIGVSVKELIVPALFVFDQSNPKIRKFDESFKNTFETVPGTIHSYLGYEAIEILISAFEKRNYSPKKIYDYITGKDNFETVIGTINFDKYGNASREFKFYKYSEGKFIYDE
jgi:ABC-type branched-subunit amino acid transport system substrate-binding protein